MKHLYSENGKILMKKIEATQMNERTYCAHGQEEKILLKYPYCSKQSTDSMKSYQNTNGIFHRTGTNNPKICMETQNTLNIKAILRNKKKLELSHSLTSNNATKLQ